PLLTVPNFFLRTLLPALGARAAWKFLWISGGGFLYIAAFVFSDLYESAFCQNRIRLSFGNVFAFFGIFIFVLHQQPLPVAGAHQDERAFQLFPQQDEFKFA